MDHTVNMRSMVLLDIKGLLMYCYHRGQDANAILDDQNQRVNTFHYGIQGFIEDFLRPILQEHAPLNVVAVWDGGNNYRKGIFAGYKAKRHAAEKNKVKEGQLDQLYKATKALLAYAGAWNVHVDGVEADDVIARFCQDFAEIPKFIYSVDRDLGQLRDDKTLVFYRMQLPEDFNGHPFKFTALQKSIVGDSSDEYGGVKGMGAVAFNYLATTYGYDGLEELEACVRTGDFKPLEEAAESTGCGKLKTLLQNKAAWRLMYDLARFHPELCYGVQGQKIIRPVWYARMPSEQRLKDVLGMCRSSDYYSVFEPHMPAFKLLDADRLQEVGIEYIKSQADAAPFFAFDYESYDTLNHDWAPALPASMKVYVDVLSQKTTGASFTVGANLQDTYYLPMQHRDTANVGENVWVDLLKDRHEKQMVLVHNASFEEQVTKLNFGYVIEGIADSMIWSSYVDENEHMGLKDNSLLHFGYTQTSYEELMEKYGAEDMRDLSGEEVLSYGCDDAFCTARLGVLFWMILRLEHQWQFVYDWDRYPVHPLARAFETGVNIDYDRMRELQAGDKATADSGMLKIRTLLQEHCQGVNDAGALALKAADLANLKAVLKFKRGDKLNGEQIQVKMEEQYERWRQASVYRPYSQRFEPAEFKPTPTQLTEIAVTLGCNPIDKVSKKGISEWLMAHREMPDLAADPRRVTFCEMLGDAAHQLKDRQGAEYEAFKAWVEKEFLSEKGRVIQEGDELNLNSPDQVAELLYCKLALPVRLRTMPQKGSVRAQLGLEGSPGTDDEAMQMAIAEDTAEGGWQRDLLKTLIEVKECLTRESLFYKKYPHWPHPRDGMIHPGIKNCGTVTRRPKGTCPNVLQVSKGPLRSIFIPRLPKSVIVSPDFSGQELRLTGSEAKDPVMIKAYTGGGTYVDEYGMTRWNLLDIHSVTGCTFARRVLAQELGAASLDHFSFDDKGVMDYDQFRALLKDTIEHMGDLNLAEVGKVVNQIRKMAKVVNFLIIYGGTAFTLAMKLGVPEAFAENLMNLVFTGYPRLGPWQEETIKLAAQQGYVVTAYGTRKHVDPNILSRDRSARRRAERQAVNQVIQGGAADILKVALTNVHKTDLLGRTGATLYAPVYDELTHSVPIDRLFEFCQGVQDCMNVTPPGHPIPMMAEISIGKDWYDVNNYELGDRPSEQKIEKALSKMFDKKVAA